MQEGFLIQGLVLPSVPRARRLQTTAAVTRDENGFGFSFNRRVCLFWESAGYPASALLVRLVCP